MQGVQEADIKVKENIEVQEYRVTLAYKAKEGVVNKG